MTLSNNKTLTSELCKWRLLPVQVCPFPVYPVLQLHVYDPSISVQVACWWHGSLSHSLISKGRSISVQTLFRKNILCIFFVRIFDFFSCLTVFKILSCKQSASAVETKLLTRLAKYCQVLFSYLDAWAWLNTSPQATVDPEILASIHSAMHGDGAIRYRSAGSM